MPGVSRSPAAGMTATRAALRHMKSLQPTARALATRIAACSSMILPVSICANLKRTRKRKVMIKTAKTVSIIA